MVTVFLRGGLGNQMFQYAAGLAAAKRNRTTLALDTVFLNDRFPRKEFSYRTYDLEAFNIDAALTPLSKISAAMPIPGAWLGLDLALIKARDVMHVRRVVKEKTPWTFDPSVREAHGELLLWGRWESEQYFADAADDVARSLALKIPLAGEAARVAEEIAAASAVSLHVRRGDYAAFKSVEALHGSTDLSYYGRATAYIAERVTHPHFFIFSDDIPWCKENLKLPFPMTFVEPSAAGPHNAFHMELMSRSAHNIVANSTFSWWGAWRNKNPEKIVVAPKQWYGHAASDPTGRNIVPSRWVRI